MKLVDRQTGDLVDVPDAQAQAAFMSGKFGVPKGGELPVVTEAGAVGTVAAQDATQAFDAGAQVAPEATFRQAETEGRYGGVGGALAAGAVGAVRGAGETFGLPTDAAAIALAETNPFGMQGRQGWDPYRGAESLTAAQALRRDLVGLKEANPFASGLGEIGGMVGVAALTGGAGGLLGRAGLAAEGAAGAMGLGRGAGMVARGAAEGGMLGGVGAINEAALGDEKVTASKVLAAIGHGALIGGATTGAFHLASEAVAGTRDAAGRWIGKLRGKDVEALAERQFGYVPEGLGDAVTSRLAGEGGEAATARFERKLDDILEHGIKTKADPELLDAVRAAKKTGDVGALEKMLGEEVGVTKDGIVGRLKSAIGDMKAASLDDAQELYARGAAAVSGKDVDTVRMFTSLSREGAEARRIGVFDADRIAEDAQRALRKHGDEILAADKLVTAEARGALKREQIARIVKTGNEDEAVSFANGQLDKLIEAADFQLSQEVAPSMTKGIESVSKLAYRAKAALDAGDNVTAFIELDGVKRGVQQLAKSGSHGVMAIADPVDRLNAQRTVEWFRTAASELRSGLERDELWGKAAEAQRQINAAWTKQIDASGRFHKALTTEVGRDPSNPYLQIRGIDPAKAETYTKSLTNPNNDLTHKAVRDYVDGTADLTKTIRKYYDLPPDALEGVEAAGRAAESFRGTVAEAERTLTLANQFKALTANDADSFAGVAGMIGFGLGGLPGGLIGGAVGALAKPGKVVAALAGIERLASKVDSKIARGVSEFLGGSRKATVGEAVGMATAGLKGERVTEPLGSSATAILRGPGGERAVFERKVAEVVRLASNPEEQVKRVERFTAQFEGQAPGFTSALVAVALRGTEYLAKHSPPGFAERPEAAAWGIKEAPLYSDAEMREWARRAAVVNDWTTILDSMRRGMVTPEEAHALREVHQEAFAALQQQIQMQAVTKQGQTWDYQKRLQLEVAFGVPLERTLNPDLMTAMQASFATPEPNPPPGGTPMQMGNRISGAAQTDAQAIEGD